LVILFFILSIFSNDNSSIVVESAPPPENVGAHSVVEKILVPDYSSCDLEHFDRIVELGDLAEYGGFPDEEIVTAVAVAFAESNGEEGAVNINRNGSRDSGIWQLNSVHGYEDLHDPLVNARAAFEVWEMQGWRAWYAHTPRGGEYGSGKWFVYWYPIVECILEPNTQIVFAH
jgi:hypothetical protein